MTFHRHPFRILRPPQQPVLGNNSATNRRKYKYIALQEKYNLSLGIRGTTLRPIPYSEDSLQIPPRSDREMASGRTWKTPKICKTEESSRCPLNCSHHFLFWDSVTRQPAPRRYGPLTPGPSPFNNWDIIFEKSLTLG